MNDRHPSGDPYPLTPDSDADYASYSSYEQQGVQYGGHTGYDGYGTYAEGATGATTTTYAADALATDGSAADAYGTGHYATNAYTSNGYPAESFATGSFTPGAFAAWDCQTEAGGGYESDPLFGDLPGPGGTTDTSASDSTGSYATGNWNTAATQDPYGYAAQQHQSQGTDYTSDGYGDQGGYGATGYDTSGQWDATAWNGAGEWETHSYAQQAPAAHGGQDPLLGTEFTEPHQYDPYDPQNPASQDPAAHGYSSPDPAAHQGYQADGTHAPYGDGYGYEVAPAADDAYDNGQGVGHADPGYDNPSYDEPAGAHDLTATHHYADADHYGEPDPYSPQDHYAEGGTYADSDGGTEAVDYTGTDYADPDAYPDDDAYADPHGTAEDDTAEDGTSVDLPEEAPGGDLPRPRSANRAAARAGGRGSASRARARRRPAKRSALLTVVVPSACVIGVAGVAAAAVGGGSSDTKDTTASGTPVKPSVANNKLDTQLENLSADAGDFADRASRTQERIDLKAKQEEARKKAAEAAARKEALRPKYLLPVAQKGLSAYFGQAGVNWMSVHTGIDFPVAYGTQVMSAIDGTVRTQYNVAYGNMAIVTAKDGTETWYCHLSSYKVSSGTTIKAGDVIAFSGNSGNSTGPHLHFEVHPGGGAAIDPLPWLRSHGLDPT